MCSVETYYLPKIESCKRRDDSHDLIIYLDLISISTTHVASNQPQTSDKKAICVIPQILFELGYSKDDSTIIFNQNLRTTLKYI